MKNLTEKLRATEKRHAEAILSAIGARPQVGKRHQRCPFPDHDDRKPSFRYDPESGLVFCTCLDKQGGISLTNALMRAQGITEFARAVQEIEAITGEKISGDKRANNRRTTSKPTNDACRDETDEIAARRAAEEQAEATAAAEERVSKIVWMEAEIANMQAVPGTPAERYLLNIRKLDGIDLDQGALRYAPEFRCKPDGTAAPALVAIATDDRGNLVGMQGTLLEGNGQPKRDRSGKKIKLSAGFIGEGLVRIANKLGTGTIAIAEGLETGLTRLLASPAEIRICLGAIRPVPIPANAGRVEIIADSDKVQACRRTARQLAEENRKARIHVVTVPTSLGETADLNDLLLDMGARAVSAAVDDADRIFARQRRDNVEQLVRGSDEEIADRVLETLEDLFGTIVITEGAVWKFDGKIWTEHDANRVTRIIAGFDGATYVTPTGQIGVVKISSSKAKSVAALLMSKRDDDGFFENAPLGITCDSGFIAFDPVPESGTFISRLEPHARRHRARHTVRGIWPTPDADKRLPPSDLMKLLDGLFSAKATHLRLKHEAPHLGLTAEAAEQDRLDRIELVMQTAAAAALGVGTQMKHPQAMIWIGPGGAGKSTTRKVISSLISDTALRSVPPAKMSQDYFIATLRGSALNVAEETSDRDLSGDAVKKIITGDICHARLPYGIPFAFIPTAQHIFICNDLPAFSSGIDSGVERRLKVLVFDNAYSEAKADEGLANRIIQKEADLLLHLVVEAAARVLSTRHFVDPATSRIAKEAWMRDADRVRAWAADRLTIKAESTVTVAELYQDFRAWCSAEGIPESRIPARNSFSRRLRRVEPRLVSGPNSAGARFKNAALRPG